MGIFLFYYILICYCFVAVYKKILIFIIGRNRINKILKAAQTDRPFLQISLATTIILPAGGIITAISKSGLISFLSFSGTWIKAAIIIVITMIFTGIAAYASAAIITAIISTTTPVTTKTSTYITHNLFPLFYIC